MSTNRSADFSDQLLPGIRHTVILNMRRPTEFTRIFNMKDSKKRDEIDSLVTGFGAMPKKGEGVPIFYDAALEGPRTTYVHESYGMGFRVTEELVDDELYGHIKKLPKNLATSAMQTVEVTSANLINNGFSAVTGADGVSLFNTAHPLVGGGTASNTFATSTDLNPTSLKDAIVRLEDTTDDRGIPLLYKARTLIVPSDKRWLAQELLKSKQKPGSADNDFNPLAEADLGWMIWRYLTDTDSWYLQANEHELNYFWRKRPVLKNSFDFDSGDAKFKMTMRFSVGHSDWRGIFGATGT